MLALKRRDCPVDYRMCNQTVTVYHWDGKDAYEQLIGEAYAVEVQA